MSSSHSQDSTPEALPEKSPIDRIAAVHNNERVPGHSNYYEKDGLRTEGDGVDHEHEPPVHFRI